MTELSEPFGIYEVYKMVENDEIDQVIPQKKALLTWMLSLGLDRKGSWKDENPLGLLQLIANCQRSQLNDLEDYTEEVPDKEKTILRLEQTHLAIIMLRERIKYLLGWYEEDIKITFHKRDLPFNEEDEVA